MITQPKKMDTYRFNEKRINGIISKKHNHKQHRFDNAIEKQIVNIASSHPRTALIWDSLHGHYVY